MISTLALLAAFWGVKPDRFIAALAAIRYAYLIPIVLLIVAGLLARGRAWQILLGRRVPFRRVFQALNEGYLINSVLPLRLGELARAYLVSEGEAISPSEALAAVVIERTIDILVSFLVLLFSLSLVLAPLWARNLLWTAGALLLLALLALLLIARSPQRSRWLVARLPGAGLRSALIRFLDGLRALLQQPVWMIQAVGWNLLAWFSSWLQVWLLLAAAGVTAAWYVPLFTIGVVAFGAAVPSSPGALGVFELSTVAALAVFGYAPETRLGVAIIFHGLVLLVPGVLGAWALAREGRRLSELVLRVQESFRRQEIHAE